MKNYINLACIAKDENLYIDEFIRFHLLVGIEHIIIYDNDSEISLNSFLTEFIDNGVVTVVPFPGLGQQMIAYDHCLRNFGHKSKFISFQDVDEFIIPKSYDTVPEVLEQWERGCQERDLHPGGYALNWRIFGSSGHQTKPNGLLIENYTKAIPRNHYENTHIKSIVMPERTRRSNFNPHCFQYYNPYWAYSETFKLVPNAWTEHSCEKMQLNHYFTKSLEEFKTKISRPRADTVKYPSRPFSDFDKFDQLATENDFCALKFLTQMKGNNDV